MTDHPVTPHHRAAALQLAVVSASRGSDAPNGTPEPLLEVAACFARFLAEDQEGRDSPAPAGFLHRTGYLNLLEIAVAQADERGLRTAAEIGREALALGAFVHGGA